MAYVLKEKCADQSKVQQILEKNFPKATSAMDKEIVVEMTDSDANKMANDLAEIMSKNNANEISNYVKKLTVKDLDLEESIAGLVCKITQIILNCTNYLLFCILNR